MYNQTNELVGLSQDNDEMQLTDLELLDVLGGNASDVNGPDQAGIVGRIVEYVVEKVVEDMLFGSGTRGPSAPENPSNGTRGRGSNGGGGGAGGAGG